MFSEYVPMHDLPTSTEDPRFDSYRANPFPPHTSPPLEPNISISVRYEVLNAIKKNSRFEPSDYGPWNVLFRVMYPTERQFMVKPQRRVLREVVATLETVDLAPEAALFPRRSFLAPDQFDVPIPQDTNVSLDSTRAPRRAQGRSEGPEPNVNYPCFVITKFSLGEHYLTTLIDVTDRKFSKCEAVARLCGYLAQAAPKKRRHRNLKGFLIMGERTEWYYLSGPEPNAEVLYGGELATMSQNFIEKLYGEAKDAWNLEWDVEGAISKRVPPSLPPSPEVLHAHPPSRFQLGFYVVLFFLVGLCANLIAQVI